MIRSGRTIAAIATAVVPEEGSVGIVRLSGDKAYAIAKKIFTAPGKQQWESHKVLYGYIHSSKDSRIIDEALLILMLAPRSYTREDIVEFHCHGGIIVVQQVLQLCIKEGAILAEHGEFTLRAFLNGRIDLTQAESISEIVGAKSPLASQIAMAGIQGKLSNPIKNLRLDCLELLSEIESRIDFEEDLPPLSQVVILQKIQDFLHRVKKLLSTSKTGELLRSGLKIAILGRPNVGKSSLLNSWSRSNKAIVTDLPGTTRDIVESNLIIKNIPIKVLDTAGIRHTDNQIEKIGVQRTHLAANQADLILLTIDAQIGWTEEETEIYKKIKHLPITLIVNKIDLNVPDLSIIPSEIQEVIKISAIQNLGIDSIEEAILNFIYKKNLIAKNVDFTINQRQLEILIRVKIAFEDIIKTINNELPLDFITIDLRSAIKILGEITGDEVTESLLSKIFSTFCIGK